MARCGAKPYRYANAFTADGDAHSADGNPSPTNRDSHPANGDSHPTYGDAGAYRQRHAVAADCDDSSADADDGWTDADVIAANLYFHSTNRHRDNCSTDGDSHPAYGDCERDARATDAHAFTDAYPAAAACSWIPYSALW